MEVHLSVNFNFHDEDWSFFGECLVRGGVIVGGGTFGAFLTW